MTTTTTTQTTDFGHGRSVQITVDLNADRTFTCSTTLLNADLGVTVENSYNGRLTAGHVDPADDFTKLGRIFEDETNTARRRLFYTEEKQRRLIELGL